jgi:hypothetical protein
MANFRDSNWDLHLIDQAGNHFINKKCVNPKVEDQAEIGDTHPEQHERTELPEITERA